MKKVTLTQTKVKWAAAIFTVCLMLTCLASGAFAQNAKLNLSFLDKLSAKASKVVNVNLDQPMLQVATRNVKEKGAALRGNEMLQHLKGVYVRVFQFDKPGEYSHADVEKVLKQLRSGGWENVVNVEKKKEGETTAVYVMKDRGETLGMTVVAAKPLKLTVVNLVGPVDFDQLSNLDNVFDAVGMQHAQSTRTANRASAK